MGRLSFQIAGRPKSWAEVNALARQHTAAAIEALVKSLGDRRIRAQAAQALLDRGWGKPALAIDMAAGPPPTANQFLQGFSEGLDRLSAAELQQLIELFQKVEGTPGRGG